MEVRKNCVRWRESNFWKRIGKSSTMQTYCALSSLSSSISHTKLCPRHWKKTQTSAYTSVVAEASKNSLHIYREALTLFSSWIWAGETLTAQWLEVTNGVLHRYITGRVMRKRRNVDSSEAAKTCLWEQPSSAVHRLDLWLSAPRTETEQISKSVLLPAWALIIQPLRSCLRSISLWKRAKPLQPMCYEQSRMINFKNLFAVTLPRH